MNKKTGRTVGYFQTDTDVSTIYIGNLKFNKSEMDIKKIFDKYGKVKFVNLLIDEETNKSKGFAFVQMPNAKHAKNAISELDGTQMDGRTLKVSIAQNRIPKDFVFNKGKSSNNKKKIDKEEDEEIKPRKKKRERGLSLLFNHLGK